MACTASGADGARIATAAIPFVAMAGICLACQLHWLLEAQTSSLRRRRLTSAKARPHQKTLYFYTKDGFLVSLLCFGASLVSFWVT